MSITMEVLTVPNESVTCFADQIADLVKCDVEGVSDETLQGIIEAAAKMEPLPPEAFRGGKLGRTEGTVFEERMVAVFATVYHESDSDKETGLELVAFAARRLGCTFKPLKHFIRGLEVDHPGSMEPATKMIRHHVTMDNFRNGRRK